MELRPQQIEFEDAIREAFRRHRRVIGVAPTGFGKGYVFADMALKSVDKGKTVLGITHRQVVADQLEKECQKAGIGTGTIRSGREPDPEARVQIAMIQTLQRRKFEGLPEAGFAIIDECHQMHDAYRRLLCERFPNIPALGLTATPVGPGGARIGHFQAVVEPIRNSQVIAAGHLLRVEPYLAPSEPDLGGIELKRMSQNEVGERVEACTIHGDVFKFWEPYSHLQTLWVFPNRAVCNQWHKIMMAMGHSAKIVDGTTEQSERDDTFSEFKEQDCKNLLGVDVVREGLDLPVAQCLVDLQPTHQFRVYWQKLGRVKRPHPGQQAAVVIDLAGNLWRHMVHPDQDPPWDEVSRDHTVEEIIERKAGVRCPACGSKEIYGPDSDGRYKCEDCKEAFATKRPWVCPSCKVGLAPWQKCVGGKCPNCGAKVSSKPVRQIRMVDGSMRTVPADEIKRRKKKNVDSEHAEWKAVVFAAIGANAKIRRGKGIRKEPFTFNNCVGWFKKKLGHEPTREMWPWPKDLEDWKRAPEAVHKYLKR